MTKINMLSSAYKVKGQGVLSAYIEQVNLVSLGLKGRYDILINQFRFCDIMHYHTIDLKFFLSIPFSKLKGTTVAYVHFIPETLEDSLKLPRFIKIVFYKYVIWFYKSVDHLVVVNPYFIDKLKNTYGIDEDKISYIPNFVSEDNFYRYDSDRINSLRQKFNILLKGFVVLGVGQVQNRKGVMDFIEVAKKLPNIQFIWAGGFSFGSITDGYKELNQIMNNPPQNVKFLGIMEREEMNDVYNLADLMFLPSYNELFPMSVLEAMALKKPVLLRNLDIYHNILFDCYLKGNNAEEFAQVIKEIMEDKELYNLWCEKSWDCHEFYSEKYVLGLWEHFYDEIYDERNKTKLRGKVDEK